MKKHPDMPMNTEELAKMREKLAGMIKKEPEAKVRAYLDKVFPRLPKATQEEITLSFFISSLRDEAQELDVLSAVQEEGLKAIGQLEAMKAEVEKEQEA